MKYDPVKLPVGSLERAVVPFKKGDLVSALKTCRNSQIAPQSLSNELQNCIQKLQGRKQYGTILSAYYAYSSDIDKAVGQGSVSPKKLLKQMFEVNDIPGFLKQAYRFNLYKGLENEIEQAIL